MARAYSQDLRDRVIDASFSGTSARRAADRFGIGLATAIRWVRQARETGDRTPGRQGQPRRSKLDPYRDYILRLVETTPDMTISETLEKLDTSKNLGGGSRWPSPLRTFRNRTGNKPESSRPNKHAGSVKLMRTRQRSARSGLRQAAS
jgi:transposase